ncbi:cell division control protein 45 homolog [Aricia agestis]|uniref:cell division control protein 45 homolog n=1 Tax=Aricia agestis TaxID=91739 RepID=UPI001C20972A|nr:cell division control protein 45 homolog [Aricia agestis]
MFIEDIKNDFYNVLLGNRVLLLVHYDVDAVCACKILQDLFQCDNISYTLVPVGGISELKTAYEENNEEIKYVVLVNCGGTVDLVDILQPEEDVVFFVLDSHKPTDICNVYSDGQVRLVYKDEEENIPNFDDIFRDDDEENDDELEGMERVEEVVRKRKERKAWEERRHTLMFNYTQFSYYGKPSACVALEVAERTRGAGVSALWAAAVASASHDALALRPAARALLDAEPLHRRAAVAQASAPDTAGVCGERDALVPLYRWWSLEEALRHAAGVGARLRLHSAAPRLRQLLADMGVPLQQARQHFRAMDVELRRGWAEALAAAAPRYGLPDPARLTFVLRRPHAPPLAAVDHVYAIMALLEHESMLRAEGFQLALCSLGVAGGAGGAAGEALATGVRGAQRALAAASRAAAAAITARALRLAGPFAYFIIPEGSPEAALLAGPLWLRETARWAAAAGGGSRPLLCAAPLPHDRCLLLGLPPRAHQEPRNLFGAAFEQAAARSGADVSLDLVDTSVVSLPAAQRAQFLDALTALLA